jgi:hypothetical protein
MTNTKKYIIPVVSGYFTPHSSLLSLTVLHDALLDAKNVKSQLHFNDLYQVFMHRMAKYAITDTIAKGEEDKLASLFLELVKTKRGIKD